MTTSTKKKREKRRRKKIKSSLYPLTNLLLVGHESKRKGKKEPTEKKRKAGLGVPASRGKGGKGRKKKKNGRRLPLSLSHAGRQEGKGKKKRSSTPPYARASVGKEKRRWSCPLSLRHPFSYTDHRDKKRGKKGKGRVLLRLLSRPSARTG